MDYLKEEKRIREAEMYEEMKDLGKLKKMLMTKVGIFEERKSKLRGLVINNLKSMIKIQIRALDEEYCLIGLDKEIWDNEEHLLHEIEKRIEASNEPYITKEQKEGLIRNVLGIEKKEEGEIRQLVCLIKEYIVLLYQELKLLESENLIEIRNMMHTEAEKINEIGKIISIEEEDEDKAIGNI
jgi:hypothetical protein